MTVCFPFSTDSQNCFGDPMQPICTFAENPPTTGATKAQGMRITELSGDAKQDEAQGHAVQAESPGQRPVWGDGFEIETVLNIRASAARLAITEVPSFEHARIHGESNLRTLRDGRRVLRTILTEWRRP